MQERMQERETLIAEFVRLSGRAEDAGWLADAAIDDLRGIVAGAKEQRAMLNDAFDPARPADD